MSWQICLQLGHASLAGNDWNGGDECYVVISFPLGQGMQLQCVLHYLHFLTLTSNWVDFNSCAGQLKKYSLGATASQVKFFRALRYCPLFPLTHRCRLNASARSAMMLQFSCELTWGIRRVLHAILLRLAIFHFCLVLLYVNHLPLLYL